MFAIILSLLCSIRQGFRTRAAIQAEILALRHQLLVLQRSARAHKVRLTASDRVWLSRLWREWRSALLIVKPETVIAWRRRGFRLYCSWKSRHPQGQHKPTKEISAVYAEGKINGTEYKNEYSVRPSRLHRGSLPRTVSCHQRNFNNGAGQHRYLNGICPPV